MAHNRIWIIGPMGSGKSFLADKLSERLKIKHYDLDDIFWLKKYTKERTKKYIEQKLKTICSRKKWIIEGVYNKSWTKRAIKNSELVIWLDMSHKLLAWRIITRYLRAKEDKGDWRDVYNLIKNIKKYKQESYRKHKKIIKKSKIDFIYIRSKRELNLFLDNY